jgi:UDP-N-acetylmuramate--alanine ligase
MNLAELKKSKIHFVGVGGSGMSGLARISLAMGIATSGSDAKDSQTLKDLASLGAEIFVGHNENQVKAGSVVVLSSAISDTNPEVIKAKTLNLPILSRAQTLALFMEGKKSIAVAGTHGKTTTTSMLTVALQSLGLNPSFAIGGTINRGGTNAHFGSGDYFVAEADESDGSFLEYRPLGAIITNIELDHVDNFPDITSIMELFKKFIASIQPGGFLVAGTDSPKVRELLALNNRSDLKIITYGKSDANLIYSHIALKPSGALARVTNNGKVLGELEISVPGEHNISNALAVIGVGIATEQPVSELISGIKSFTGARRRFEIKGKMAGVTVIDDYGHHPTEIKVTLTAARTFVGSGRVIVIFQPHRYSRTAAFVKEFAEALSLADQIYLLEVYSAGENPIPGVSSKLIADLIPNAIYNPSMIEVVDAAANQAKSGDLIITLGAGDVSALAPAILENLNAR